MPNIGMIRFSEDNYYKVLQEGICLQAKVKWRIESIVI